MDFLRSLRVIGRLRWGSIDMGLGFGQRYGVLRLNDRHIRPV